VFKKILIANRGEIACRVIDTARKMGIATVAVHSDVDRDARHVTEADEAYCIGSAAAAESYLVAEKIVQACKDSGAEAVHPGYGFLSENAGFAELLETEGIVFIGPGAYAIQAMGDKITSKLLAEKSGVNTIPGHNEVVASADEAVKISNGIGYPVMIKASAGGGGKGMRVAFNDDECRDGFDRATSEAISSFGDGRIFIEKFIEQPRHIEIQVIADSHGNVVALNERECSIQRRHQKVIEEAPSPFLDDKTRKAMSDQAITLARAVDYRSAGTVEFIVDGSRNFYFLEMNTRLQVEHPVTEMITGLDLVELMIRVADGEKLPITQKDVGINGWAMEARVYAENPYRNFLPSTGRLREYQPPPQDDHVRVDSGVVEGSDISMYYDPLIAKLVTWGDSRQQAIDKMLESLDQYYIRGVDTNLPFVSAVMRHSRFQAGKLTTNFIAEEYPDGFNPQPIDEGLVSQLVCVMASIHHRLTHRAATVSNQVEGYGRNVSTDWTVVIGRQNHNVSIDSQSDCWNITLDGREYRVEDHWLPTQNVYAGKVDGRTLYLQVEKTGFSYEVVCGAFANSVLVMTRPTARLNDLMPLKQPPDVSKFLLSPMPGLLVSLSVEAGQRVKAGQELAVVEAMKMENSLKADQDCTVAKVMAEPGATLEVDQPIVEFE
jgi:propionyl-CoA carboxylase alpha chain